MRQKPQATDFPEKAPSEEGLRSPFPVRAGRAELPAPDSGSSGLRKKGDHPGKEKKPGLSLPAEALFPTDPADKDR
jgi:hypothetical protein